MHSPGKDRLGVITDDAGIPLVAGLDSPIALDRTQVGDAVALLARTRALGLRVPDGFAMTTRGVTTLADPADHSAIDALRHAWSTIGDPALLRLSGGSAGMGYRVVDGNGWDAVLDGLCAILRHDMLENFGSSRRAWAFLVMRRPVPEQSALVMTGDPFGGGRGITILSRDGDATASLGRRRCRWLRGLAGKVEAGLGHPVDLEVVFDASGAGWIVDCLPYRPPLWS
jgi:hypothetical protein